MDSNTSAVYIAWLVYSCINNLMSILPEGYPKALDHVPIWLGYKLYLYCKARRVPTTDLELVAVP